MGFKPELRERVEKARGKVCQKCGNSSGDIHHHHVLPEQMGGASDIDDNDFLACDGCHPALDSAAIKHGRLANGLHVVDVETEAPELICHNGKYQKAKRRFNLFGRRE